MIGPFFLLAALALVQPLIDAQAQDAAVAAIAYRLQTKGAALCKVKAPQTGLVLHDLNQYDPPDRAVAQKQFGLGAFHARPLAVVPGGAAARAGLQNGDDILRINGQSFSATPSQKATYASVQLVEDAFIRAVAAGPVTIMVRRGDFERTLTLTGDVGCASRVQIIPGRKLNASADGIYVQLTGAVIGEAASDDELASIIAHEMAHNILGHRAWLDKAGRNIANIRKTEIEADALSVYLLARAGYDPFAPARFWARFGKKTGAGIFSDGTHLRTKARVEFLTKTAAALSLSAQ